MRYRLTINDAQREIDADPDMPLLWLLRDVLGLTGSKYGCGKGLCGACTVLVGERPVRSCLTSVGAVAGRSVRTVEGLAAIPVGERLSRAFATLPVSQCGYCQAGQLVSATALLLRNPAPDDGDIDRAMAGNLCRCGTYGRIRRAIRAAAGDAQAARGPA